MMLIIAPAIDGLKKEWSEAAATLGATQAQFWRYIGLPVLWPKLLGTLSLLFANAFGAIATAYALTGSSLNIVPILLYAQIRGDVLHNPHSAPRIAFGMIVITGFANVIYIWSPHPRRKVAQMKSVKFWSWVVFALGAVYFLVPLIATFEFSLRMRRGVYSFDAYQIVLADPQFQADFVLFGGRRASSPSSSAC